MDDVGLGVPLDVGVGEVGQDGLAGYPIGLTSPGEERMEVVVYSAGELLQELPPWGRGHHNRLWPAGCQCWHPLNCRQAAGCQHPIEEGNVT